MITFVPAWRDNLKVEGGRDDLIGQIKAFILSGSKYQIIISDYLPNLRYFLHYHDLLESNYFNLFDELQESVGVTQKGITLFELNYPQDSTFIYGPFFILVYQREKVIGKIILGEGGHIAEVHHVSGSKLETIEIYDDRGFISSRKIFDDGEERYTEFLDYNGEWIFRELKNSGTCIVNDANSKELSQKRYDSFSALMFEKIEQKLRENSSHQSIIMSVTNENLSLIGNFGNFQEFTLSFFQNRCDSSLLNSQLCLEVVNRVKATIVDSNKNFEKLYNLSRTPSTIYKVCPYDTRFELGISQELKEEVIYANFCKQENNQAVLEILLTYLIKTLSKSENTRAFELVFRVEDVNQVSKVKNKVKDILYDYFPEEIAYLQLLEGEEQRENTVDEQVIELELPKVKVLKEVIDSIKVVMINTEDELFKLIYRARLIVDIGKDPDLLTQICGISAAIPQINFYETEYVQHKRNGFILESFQDLYQTLEYYLEELKHWQEARAFSVQQIKKYSGFALHERILEISKGVVNE